MKELLTEFISAFMETVPSNPEGGEREWSSGDMASYLLGRLDDAGCVRVILEQEMPHITEEIAADAAKLVAEGADLFTAGAGGMWIAVQQNGFRKVISIMDDLTKPEFEALLTKAAQPLPKPKPDQEAEQTSEQPTSGDCNENHTR